MQTLEYQVRDGVATITLDRPDARNALSPTMKDEFADALARATADQTVRAAILTGAGGVFSAGGDIRGMQALRGTVTVESGRERMQALHPLIRALVGFDKPLIAAVDGAAFGAGFSMALAADFVLASPRARFCLAFMRIGLVPDFATMYLLPRVVGVQRAKELMLSAREVAVDEALRLGLVLEVVPAEGLMDRARALARSFVGASALGVSLIKREVGMALATDLTTQLTLEANDQALCFETPYQAEAVRRFLAKEPAMFQWPSVSKVK